MKTFEEYYQYGCVRCRSGIVTDDSGSLTGDSGIVTATRKALMEAVLSRTLSIPIIQEQVMQIAMVAA